MNDDPILCYCFNVTRKEALEHFAKAGATLDGFVEKTRATTKCTACALDLDMLLDDIHSSERISQVRAAELAASKSGLHEKIDRVDSGFFICDGEVRTHICLANHPSIGGSSDLCAAHDFKLKLFDNEGRVCASQKGCVGIREEVVLRLADLPLCPEVGWFHLHLMPKEAGRYGTLRPQVALEGENWAACYHTQFHTDATYADRRNGIALRSLRGNTRTTVSVINGNGRRCTWKASLEWPGERRTAEGVLPGNGACMIEIDRSFEQLPENETVLFRIESDQPTRKNIINRHPDGSLGLDHFPNLV